MIASLNTWARPGCPSAPSRAPIREPCGALDRPFPGEVPHAHKRKVSDIRLKPARDDNNKDHLGRGPEGPHYPNVTTRTSLSAACEATPLPIVPARVCQRPAGGLRTGAPAAVQSDEAADQHCGIHDPGDGFQDNERPGVRAPRNDVAVSDRG